MRSNKLLCLEAYGNAILIESESESILALLGDELKRAIPCMRPLSLAREKALLRYRLVQEPEGRVSFFESGECIARNVTLDFAIDQICNVARLKVAEHAIGMTFLHAGVVQWRDKAIVLPAQSTQGKTSLVAELVRRGAVYFSDEYAVLDREGRVHPFPKPLSVREDPRSPLQTDYDVKHFGGSEGTERTEVGLILFTAYSPGSVWRPKKLAPAAAVLEMVKHCVPIRRAPEATLEVLRTLANSSPAFSTPRGEATTASQKILDLLEGRVP